MRILRAVAVAATALLLAATWSGAAVAQDLRGSELRLNQLAGGFSADVAVQPNGDFVAVWFSQLRVGGAAEVRARQFFADGKAKGGDLVVAKIAKLPTFGQSPHVAVDAAGRFLVVWDSPRVTTQGVDRVFAQRFDAAGRKLGARLPFKAQGRGQWNPDVAMAPDGRAVVVWDELTDRFDSDGFLLTDVYFRRLQSNGAFAGPAVLAVPEGETSRVVMRTDGSFALATEYYNGEASFYDIYFSLYSNQGATLREPFEITSGLNETATQSEPAIAAGKDGRMFVAWTDRAADTDAPDNDLFYDPIGVAGQLIAADGSLIGENLPINTFKKGPQERASVAATPNGGFLVSWQTGANQDGDGYGIFARHFAGDGRRLGAELRINLARQGNQLSPSLALNADGHGVVAWSGQGSIAARRLAPPER